MANFVLVYRGGAMGETPEEQQASMEKWMAWFGGLGGAVVDPGAPFGASRTATGGGEGPSALTGYSILVADDIDDATTKAKGCPVIETGGSVEVYEALPIG